MSQTLPQNPEIENRKTGTLFFLAADLMFFTGLLGAFVVLRQTVKNWPGPSVLDLSFGISGIVLLILSSLALIRNKTAASMLAGGFLLIRLFEFYRLWTEKNIQLSNSLFGACFYILNGLHAFHVLAGILCAAAVSKPALMKWYWHFTAAMGAVLFASFYLIG